MGFLPIVPMGVLVHPGHHGSVNPREFELGEMVNLVEVSYPLWPSFLTHKEKPRNGSKQ